MPSDPRDALKAWFLGPRAENAELLERLVVEALRDHVFWRRNYHPEDGFTIREMDKRREGYEESVAVSDPGAHGPAGRAQARRPVLQRPLQGAHDRGADDRSADRLLRHHAVQSQQHRRRDLAGHHPAGAGGGGRARPDDRLRPGGGAGDISPRAAPSPTSRRCGSPAACAICRSPPPAPPPSWVWSCEVRLADGGTAPVGRAAALGAAQHPGTRASLDLWERLWQSAPPGGRAAARWPTTRSPRSATRSTAAVWPWTTAIRCRPASCWSPPRPTTPGRRSFAPSASGPTSWSTSRSTPASGWTRTRCGSGYASWRATGSRSWPASASAARPRRARWTGSTRCSRCATGPSAELGVTFHVHSDACYGGYAAAVTRKADGTRRIGGRDPGAAGHRLARRRLGARRSRRWARPTR